MCPDRRRTAYNGAFLICQLIRADAVGTGTGGRTGGSWSVGSQLLILFPQGPTGAEGDRLRFGPASDVSCVKALVAWRRLFCSVHTPYLECKVWLHSPSGLARKADAKAGVAARR